MSDFNYVTQEYFVSGVADGSPYATRIVVRRPAVPQKFSGLVVAEPMHFSGSALICQYAQLGIAMSGDACLEIDSEPLDLGLLQGFNSARYGSLSIVSEAQTNDILAQVGRLVRSNAPGNPFAGLGVSDVVLSGISESSNVTRAYMTAYDGGSSTFQMPDGSPIYQGFFLSSTLGPNPLPITNVPTIQMPTQNEVTAGQPGNGESSSFERPDSDSPANPFRIYEVAGMSHADVRNLPNNQGCIAPFSQFPQGAMEFMGLDHELNWVANGTVPPHAPSYIAVNPGNQVIDGTRVALDQYGNAIGGVRTPYLNVPIFTYTIPNYNNPTSAGPSFLCAIAGFQTPLPQSVLQGLYKNEGQYISAVNNDLHQLASEGWWPDQYTQSFLKADALAYAKEFLAPAGAQA
jgi:Alpha/beta hydrolase domain